MFQTIYFIKKMKEEEDQSCQHGPISNEEPSETWTWPNLDTSDHILDSFYKIMEKIVFYSIMRLCAIVGCGSNTYQLNRLGKNEEKPCVLYPFPLENIILN